MLPILITENKDKQPLLGLDWLDNLEIGLQGNRNTNITVNERSTNFFDEFEDLLKTSTQ